MNDVYVLEATHPFVPGRVVSLHKTEDGASEQAAILLNIIRADIKAEDIPEADSTNFNAVLQALKEYYAALYETDEDRFYLIIEKMEVLA